MNSTDLYDVIIKIAGEEGLKRLVKEAGDVKDALGKVTEASEAVTKKTFDMSSLAASGKGLFSAFQAGEIGGIVRGVGDLVDLVPALNMFAPAIKKIGDVSEVAWPFLKDFYTQMTASSGAPEKVAEATEAVEDYGERLDQLGETIRDVTDRHAAPSAEIAPGKKEGEDQAAAVEKLKALQAGGDVGPEEAEKERAENLQSKFRGKQEDVIERVALGMFMQEWRSAQAEKKRLGAKAGQAIARKDAGLSHEDL